MSDHTVRIRPTQGVAAYAVASRSTRRYARHHHDEFGIGLILNGGQASWSGRGPVEAGAGDVITVNPGEVHDGRPVTHAGRSWRMLFFRPEDAAALIEDLRGEAPARFEFERPVVGEAPVRALTLRLLRLETAAASDVARMAAAEAALHLVDRLIRPARPAVVRRAPRALRARQVIDDAPGEPLTLARLSEAAGLSQFQMIRAFKRETGLTPHAYLMQRRLSLARALIRGGTGLAQAAADAGFADQSHMTRAFTACFGYPPGAYAGAYAGACGSAGYAAPSGPSATASRN
ncbi:MAG: helix-turn-helix domain-containing protein [Alphaproteobacteria bacterium]|nr:helix-turn-helix domain-containing protein [Alphaproteobacteria bacterium]